MTTLGLMIIVLITLRNIIRADSPVAMRGGLALGLLIAVLPCTPWPAQILTDRLQQPFFAAAPIAWAASNVIVVLGAGLQTPTADRVEASLPSRSRALAAATAYHACRLESSYCVVIASGGDPHHAGATEASLIASLLIQLGIPPMDIETEDASRNTFTNAQNSGALIRENYPDSKIFLVTSSLHMKRSLLYFKHISLFPSPIIADWVSPKWGLRSIAYNTLMTDYALTEYIGIGRYYVYNWLGWNPPLSRASATL